MFFWKRKEPVKLTQKQQLAADIQEMCYAIDALNNAWRNLPREYRPWILWGDEKTRRVVLTKYKNDGAQSEIVYDELGDEE